MDLKATVARIERTAMRRLPASMVVTMNAMLHQRMGEPELHIVKDLVREGTIAVDVGGHFGMYTYMMARAVGKQGRVITIEPIEEDARLIDDAMRRLKQPVTVLHCALSSRDGEAEMRIPLIGGSAKTALSTLERDAQAPTASGTETRMVPTRTLDDVLRNIDRPVSFVKIDVEGHELEVLKGADDTLRIYQPNLLIEVNADLGEHDPTDVFTAVRTYGYDGWFLENGRTPKPIAAFDVERHQAAAADDVLSKAYVNNFVFEPVGKGQARTWR